MATPNPKHSDFITRYRASTKTIMDAVASHAALLDQYAKLYSPTGADPLVDGADNDFAGANADTNVADIAASASVFMAVQQQLAANNNAGFIAGYKVGR